VRLRTSCLIFWAAWPLAATADKSGTTYDQSTGQLLFQVVDGQVVPDVSHLLLACSPYFVHIMKIEGGPGYKIRKLRYEALPNSWIPALLYVPDKLSQMGAIARWDKHNRDEPVEIYAVGPRASLFSLVAAALEPAAIDSLNLTGCFGSLKAILEKNLSATLREGEQLFDGSCRCLGGASTLRFTAGLLTPNRRAAKSLPILAMR